MLPEMLYRMFHKYFGHSAFIANSFTPPQLSPLLIIFVEGGGGLNRKDLLIFRDIILTTSVSNTNTS